MNLYNLVINLLVNKRGIPLGVLQYIFVFFVSVLPRVKAGHFT